MFKSPNIENLKINIDGEKLSHFRITDDKVLVADDLEGAKQMLSIPEAASRKVGLKMNIIKTKLMINLVNSDNITLNSWNIEQMYSYKYLGHEIRLGGNNQIFEKISKNLWKAKLYAAYAVNGIFATSLSCCNNNGAKTLT